MKFKIMGKKGDNVVDYDDVETQEMKYDELIAANYLPVALNHGDKGQKVMLKAFDPDVAEILWMPKVAGG